MPATRIDSARHLVHEFALRTGLSAGVSTRRYLWTDAYAAFALAGLHRRTGEALYLEHLRRLVDVVHHTLARHRPDAPPLNPITRWISGLSESDGERHPTAGGLRIGKPLPERAPDEPFDPRLEWERDGQYFHYLTKWMLALDHIATATGDARYHDWGLELAAAAHAAFVYHQGGPPRMYWKMSVDLSRPLIASMGQLDPLDGFVAFLHLESTTRSPAPAVPNLSAQITDLRRVCEGIPTWETADALGIGGLLGAAGELTRLIAIGALEYDPILAELLADARRGLKSFVAANELAAPPTERLAFRELGLSIGLRWLGAMQHAIREHPERFANAETAASLLARVDELALFTPLADAIPQFWLTGAARAAPWDAHLDINTVMLAVALVPDALIPDEYLAAAGASPTPTITTVASPPQSPSTPSP